MAVEINKRRLLWALSGAVDYVGVTDIHHGKRVAFIANKIREEYHDFPWSFNDVITAGLLHDCGVSSTDEHEHLVKEIEWDRVQDHCNRGENLLLNQPDYRHIARAIGYHHTRWVDLSGDLDHQLANLIFLADRIDVLAATRVDDILTEKKEIIDIISSFSDYLFSPCLVNIFIKLAQKDIFWLSWSEAHTGEYLENWFNSDPMERVEYSDLKPQITLFSSCVDGKSPFTYNHSMGVAALARKIAELWGLKGEKLTKIELAGHLHDLGKLKVPDIILDKPGKLTEKEIDVIRHHSYDTFTILAKVRGLEDIAKWASQHHEKLNGSGYPWAESAKEISIESRILTIADIFQALAQSRPYKDAFELNSIISKLLEMCKKGELDRDIVELVKENRHECLEAALTEHELVDYLVI